MRCAVNTFIDEISIYPAQLEQEEAEPEETDQTERDLLPEYTGYRDEGCEYAKYCLECPFPRCLYDEHHGRQRWLNDLRNKEIHRLFKKGRHVREIADKFDVSERTVQRVIKKINGRKKKRRKDRQ
jgi:hypothetical protein